MKRRRRREQKPNQNEEVSTLVQWRLLEEKTKYTKEKELLVGLIGIAAAIVAAIFQNYTFAGLLFVATAIFILLGRQQPKEMLFKITDVGITMDDDIIPLEEIKSFNIIDDPGARARLIVKIEKILETKEIVPIYDVQIQKIEKVLESLHIKREKELQPGMIEKIATLVI